MIRSFWLFSVFCFALTSAVEVVAAKREVTFCLAKDDAWSADQHIAKMKQFGIKCATVYYKLNAPDNLKHPYDWVRDKYHRQGYEVVLVLLIGEANVSYVGTSEATRESDRPLGLLDSIVQGVYDQQLTILAERIKKVGKPITVRPLHEIDGNWYPWGMYAKGNSPELAAAAYGRIVDSFKRVDAPVSFEVNYNRRDAQQQVLGDGDRYVSRIERVSISRSVSTYDRCLSNPTLYPNSKSFAEEFRPIYQKLLTYSNQPVNVAEVSTTGFSGCQNKLKWFAGMLQSIDKEFVQVEKVTFVFGTVPVGKASNTVAIPWGFSSDEERVKFRALLDEYRQKWKGVPLTKPQEENSTKYNFSAPWSAQIGLTHLTDETDNPALNPVSGQPFGKTESVAYANVRQRILFPTKLGCEVGPGLRVGVRDSSNNEMWWNNHVSVEATVGCYRKMARTGGIQWGEIKAEIFVGQKHFTVDAPDRYTGGRETYGGIHINANFGSNWTR